MVRAVYVCKKETQSHSWTGRGDPYVCETPRFPQLLDNRLIDGCDVAALRVGRPLLPGTFLVLISVRRWVDPRAIVRLEALAQENNWFTSLGLEPATFQLVAQCLNHLRLWFAALSWVLSRQKTLDQAYVTEVNQVLMDNGLVPSQFEGVVQTDCPAVNTADNWVPWPHFYPFWCFQILLLALSSIHVEKTWKLIQT
jgi:hypothetical protein